MSLERILNAESVAIVGASKNETKRGFQTIRTLIDEKYEGKIRSRTLCAIVCTHHEEITEKGKRNE